jgi:hypothetical protein
LVVVLGAPFGYYNFALDWNNMPHCHTAVMLAMHSWLEVNKLDWDNPDSPYPNISGKSVDSLGAIHRQMDEDMDWAKDYGYVPGLRRGDPGDLVLIYFNRPTRWTMHIHAPLIFEKKGWILIPLDFRQSDREMSGPGEKSEFVSTSEFKKRLKATIDFLREKKRPNWETMVAEQTKFLQSIDSVER